MTNTFTGCERCGKMVDPDDPTLVRAAEVRRVRAFGTGIEELEGIGVLFHDSCWDEDDPDYMLRSG